MHLASDFSCRPSAHTMVVDTHAFVQKITLLCDSRPKTTRK